MASWNARKDRPEAMGVSDYNLLELEVCLEQGELEPAPSRGQMVACDRVRRVLPGARMREAA